MKNKKMLYSFRGGPLRIAIGIILFMNLALIQGALAAEIHGYFVYPTAAGGESPMRNSFFEVWKNGLLGFPTYVASGTTDLNGYFSITFDGDCGDCWIAIFTKIPNVVDVFCPVQSFGACNQELGQSQTYHYSFPGIQVSTFGSGDYGKQILPRNELITKGAEIADTILDGWLFVKKQTNVQVPKVSVQLPCGVLCPGNVYFNPYVINDILLKEDSYKEVIIHEYGHAVMFAAYGGGGDVVETIWPVPIDEQLRCLIHTPGINCGIYVAWTEGWAEFFTSAVLDSADISQGAIETPPSYWDTGEMDEGMVAATLWDLYAPRLNPGSDHFGLGFAPIFNTLWQHNTQTAAFYESFRDFYYDFTRLYPENISLFNYAAFQNTINFNNPPRITSLNVPTGSATGSALLSASGVDDIGGFVDGSVISATYEYSTDGGAQWASLGTASIESGYLWTLNFYSPSVIIRARVNDDLGANSDWMQSAPFSVQPQPPTVISPDGTENWIRGTLQVITWNSVGSPGSNVKIELLKAGVINSVIAENTPNDGSQEWNIPAIQDLGTDYKVRITGTTNAAYTDTSNNDFIISATGIGSCTVITSPGTYELTTDIIHNPAKTCINITSSDVIFDGKNHNIDGQFGLHSKNENGVLVYNSGATLTNVTIKNLKVTDWNDGIEYMNVSQGIIENIIADSTTISLIWSSKNIVRGNTISGSSYKPEKPYPGIYLSGSNNNSLENNAVSNNASIQLIRSNYNNLTGNTVSKNLDIIYGYGNGIGIWGNYNRLTNNTIMHNINGIYLSDSSYNTLSRNTITMNSYGVYLDYNEMYWNYIYDNYFNNTINSGFALNAAASWQISNVIPGSNIIGGINLGGNYWASPDGTGYSQTCPDIDNNGICDLPYWPDDRNRDRYPLVYSLNPISSCIRISVPGYYTLTKDILSSSSCITIASSDVVFDGAGHTIDGTDSPYTTGVSVNNKGMARLTNVTVKNLIVTDFDTGIYYYVDHGEIINNTIISNIENGIYLDNSIFNKITGNTVRSSGDGSGYGIYIIKSRDNTIYNNYFDNKINALDHGTNYWNTPIRPGKNIIGGHNIGGNYWSDYNGTDTNSDGLGDTLIPYNRNITNGGDYLPLTLPVTPPGITTQPVDQAVREGGTATFQIEATGTAPLTYQWQKNSVDILGATSSSYAIPATTVSENGTLFRVIVSNSAGSVTSNQVMLTVFFSPYIITQPLSQTVLEGQVATFSVVVAGSDPLSYQWWTESMGMTSPIDIPGATSPSYTTPATNLSDNGAVFFVMVSNSWGEKESEWATLTVTRPIIPKITTQPSSQKVYEGQTATFGVVATGSAPMTYQWQKSSSGVFATIPGATSSSYAIPATTVSENGTLFRVIVSNSAGNATSKPATLTVITTLVADCGPDQLKCENVGAPVQFNGSASYDTDGAIISYFWDFGDGMNTTGVAPKHTFSSYKWNGTGYEPFKVNLTVMDDSGLTNSTSQKMVIWMPGDANGDGKVNILDASVVGLKWGGNDPCADLNNDGVVNILDASIIGLNWGKSASIARITL